jgi:nicotinamidase-related amidase
MTKIDDTIRRFNTHNWLPEKGRTAVLMIDCQEYFRDIINPVLKNITSLISATRGKNIPLFFTRHGHKAGGSQEMLGRWWADLIIEGSDDARLIPELKVTERDHIIPKSTYSAFHGTALEDKLRNAKITDLVIGGVMTNLCCETTARDAFVRDFRVFFLVDGTSTVSEDFHLATLKNLGYGFATLLSCKQCIRSI